MKLKSDTTEGFKTYTDKVFTDTGKRVQTVRSDNGGEYIDNIYKFGKWLAMKGIKHQTSATHTI